MPLRHTLFFMPCHFYDAVSLFRLRRCHAMPLMALLADAAFFS